MFRDDLEAAYNRSKWSLVVRGLFSVAHSIFIMTRPFDSITALALLIPIWALSDGMMNMVRAFHLRSVAPHWGVLLLAGIVSTVFGITALYYYPAVSLNLAALWTVFGIVGGVLLLIGAGSMQSFERTVNGAVRKALRT